MKRLIAWWSAATVISTLTAHHGYHYHGGSHPLEVSLVMAFMWAAVIGFVGKSRVVE